MSTDYLAPTTELEAVNSILAAIGETPVGTLSGALPIDASIALTRLRSASRGFQSQGWSFNTDEGFTLSPEVDGRVPVPRNALNVDATETNDYVVRGAYLYDRVRHTFDIGKDVKVDIVRFLPWNQLPEYVRQFLFISTGLTFQDQMLGDESLHTFTQDNVVLARVALLDAESRNADLNVLSDSYSVGRVVRLRAR